LRTTLTQQVARSKSTFNPSTQRVDVAETKKPSGFTTEGDQVLALATSVPLGEPLPPLPVAPDIDRKMDKALKTSIVVYDDDDEKTFNQKATVAKIKDELTKYVAEGNSVSSFVANMEKVHNEIASIRNEAQAIAEKLYNEGKTEEAQKFADETNKEFIEAGVKEIKLPGLKRREMGR
jgi:gas vesicle protein